MGHQAKCPCVLVSEPTFLVSPPFQVLYNTLGRFLSGQSDLTPGQVLQGIGIFIGVFVGSVVFGSIVGLVAIFIYRTGYFRSSVAGGDIKMEDMMGGGKMDVPGNPGFTRYVTHYCTSLAI